MISEHKTSRYRQRRALWKRGRTLDQMVFSSGDDSVTMEVQAADGAAVAVQRHTPVGLPVPAPAREMETNRHPECHHS